MSKNDKNSIEYEVINEKFIQMYNLQLNNRTDNNLNSEIENYNKTNDFEILDSELSLLNDSKYIVANNVITSHRKVIGNLIILSKKITRKILKWYIEPIVEQQTNFNITITKLLTNKVENIKELFEKGSKIENQLSKIDGIESQLSKIDGIESQLSKIDGIESQLSKIDGIESQLSKIDRIESNYKIIDNLTNQLRNMENQLSKYEAHFKHVNCDTSAQFRVESYSQSGEDLILQYIFNMLSIQKEDITYLDLGANHAKELSNTYFFYKNSGKGVLVEANPELIAELKFFRHNDIIINKAVCIGYEEELDFYVLSGDGLSTLSYEAAMEFCSLNPNIKITNIHKIKTIRINDIIEKYFGKAPTFISIDLEGLDLDILNNIDFNVYRPLVIISETIQYRPYLDVNIKLNEIVDFMKSKKYIEYAFTGINSIFIDEEYLEKINQERQK